MLKKFLTQGLTFNPFSIAFFASNPSPIRTFGLEVLVHDVIAAITMAPSSSLKSAPETGSFFSFCLFVFSLRTFVNDFAASVNKTLSCGRYGPDILGTTLDISKFKVSEKIILSSAHNPCSLE